MDFPLSKHPARRLSKIMCTPQKKGQKKRSGAAGHSVCVELFSAPLKRVRQNQR